MIYAALLAALCKEYSVPYDLALSIIEQESGGSNLCFRHEPKVLKDYELKVFVVESAKFYAKKTGDSFASEMILRASSLGLMQVLGQKAREYGFEKPLIQVCDPENGLRLGLRILSDLLKKYANETDVIASYNAGSPLMKSTGFYVNQKYVDEVSARLREKRKLVD